MFKEPLGHLNTDLYRTVKFRPLCVCVHACTEADRSSSSYSLDTLICIRKGHLEN